MTFENPSSTQDIKRAVAGANEWTFSFCRWFLHAGTGLVLVLGLLMLLAAFDDERLENERLLRQSDAVLGFAAVNVLKLAGVVHLIAGGYWLITRDVLTRSVLGLWLSSVVALYRLGAGWMKIGVNSPVVTLLAHKIGISPKAFGKSWWLLLAVVVTGALWQLELERRRRRRVSDDEFLEHWRGNRSGKSHSR